MEKPEFEKQNNLEIKTDPESQEQFGQRIAELKERLGTEDRELIEKMEDKVTGLEDKIEKLEKLVTIDELTGAYNRRGFVGEAGKLLNVLAGDMQAKKERREDEGMADVAFLLIDLDGFKQINDRLGHNVGDEILKKCVSVLKENVRDLDVVGRWGGDEFTVALMDVTPEEAEKVAAKLKEIIGDIEVGGQKLKELFEDVPAGASVGVSMAKNSAPDGNFDLKKIIEEADRAMYRDKGDRKR